MKVGNVPKKDVPTKAPPILPLIIEEDDETYDKVTHTLRVIPNDNASPSYKASFRVLEGTEDVRVIIHHPEEVMKVVVGLNATTSTQRLALARTMVKGNARTQFDQAVVTKCLSRMVERAEAEADEAAAQAIRDAGWDVADNYHADDIHLYLNDMVASLIPPKSLAKVKRQLRRNCRKPTGMGIRKYYQNLYRINVQEIPKLPPFQVTSSFRDDEFIDIILYGTPKKWSIKMEEQGFDPMDHTPEAVVAFMEQLEAAEELTDEGTTVKSKDKNSKHSKSDKKKDGKHSDKKGSKYCEHHGHCAHSTEECRLNKKAKKDHGSGKGKYGNREWKRKATEEAVTSKQELAVLVKKVMRKELASVDRKRKSKDEDGDNFLVETLSKDLDGFSYNDMDNMSVDSSDEISV